MDNLEYIKESARILLFFKPVANKLYPSIIHHPYISSNPTPFQNKDGSLCFIDIFKEKDKYSELLNQKLELIDKAESFDLLVYMINKPYKLFFFDINKHVLSKETYNQQLKEIWCLTEFPNADKNVSTNESLELFKNADKTIIMDKEELSKFQHLPDEITIYRGTHKRNNSNALSWTDNYEIALWYAKRFGGNGYVLQATIKKEDVVAYFQYRYDDELIIDFNKIYNLKAEKIMNIKI